MHNFISGAAVQQILGPRNADPGYYGFLSNISSSPPAKDMVGLCFPVQLKLFVIVLYVLI